ncbi:uncharacterized protein F4822DRAFT_406280 [Hypoxylon trugodes]|uniref:uncharacterized protein n=1 Tax=Hypoxylon trugodes TaxID=326681 RepID=UPI002193CBAF|nr:uncharacterized protein F4822DRAFT_406280 [Hypoxylon trugodes]KAI1387387.1 hypothetical protein F4822DRAFT_406280 [Hypoxylon trugodes]
MASAQVAITETEQGLKVLSLDGGGVRGMSSLYILRHLMKRLQPKDTPKPCDYFDIIAGTSTGGLIAIMLGRLRMSVQDCIDAYGKLSERVFKPRKRSFNVVGKGKDLWSLSGAFDADELAQAIREVVVQAGEDGNAKLLEADPGCKVFVCAMRAEITKPVRLRSYETPTTVQEVDCTIVEAARATSAASSFFKPIVIDGQTFTDGATGYNNPVEEVFDEVNQIWPGGNRPIGLFLSIGTGTPALRSFGKNLKSLIETLAKIATETEDTAKRFQEAMRERGLSKAYFRFNAQGLERVGLEDHKSFGLIIAATNNYLNEVETRQKLNAFVASDRSFLSLSQRHFYLESLRSYDVGSELSEVSEPVSNTFEWVLEADEFLSWARDTEHPIMLIRGKPGCGKSVLLAFLKRTMPTNTTAFFACKQTEDIRRTPEMILSCLLRQILMEQPNLFRYVVPLSAGSESWTYRQLMGSFEAVLTSPDNKGITCMIDALDECHEVSRRQFIKDVSRISEIIKRQNAGYSRIIITSRHYADITFPSSVTIDLDTAPPMLEDVRRFIHFKVNELVQERPHYADDILNIRETLSEKAGGMYRLVELIVQDLLYATDSSPSAVRRILESVPQDIGEMYDRIWGRIGAVDLPRARRIFAWILLSLGPLNREAMSLAIAISSAPQGSNYRLNVPVDVEGDLRGLFGPLIRIGASIEVSHQSVRDHFLINRSGFSLYDAFTTGFKEDNQSNRFRYQEEQGQIALACLRYLNALDPDTIPNAPEPFLDYALEHFARHVLEANHHDEGLDREILLFFQKGVWQGWWYQSRPREYVFSPDTPMPSIDDLLSFACYYGRPQIVRKIRLSEDSYKSFTPLLGICPKVAVRAVYLAMIGRNEECVAESILIMDRIMLTPSTPLKFESFILEDQHETDDYSTCSCAPDEFGDRSSKFQIAVYRRVAEAFHRIQAPEQILQRSEENTEALQSRILGAYRKLATQEPSGTYDSILLENTDWTYNLAFLLSLYMTWTYGAGSVDLISPNGAALPEAVKSNRIQAVEILLHEGVKIGEISDGNGANLLHLAAETGNYELVKIILAQKAININSVDGRGLTPLHYACSLYPLWDFCILLTERPRSISRRRIVKILLESGANRVARDHLGNTPLQTLSRVYTPEWVDIPKGSSLNWRENDLGATIQLLMEDPSDILEWDSHGVTPLHYAAYLWPLSAVEQILEFLKTFFISGNLVDHLGCTPLHYAAFRGFDEPEKIVDVLCAARVDPRIQQIAGETARSVAQSYGRLRTAEAIENQEKNFEERAKRVFQRTLSGSRFPDITEVVERIAHSHAQKSFRSSNFLQTVYTIPIPQRKPSPAMASLAPRLFLGPSLHDTDYPSLQLHNQVYRVQQFLTLSRPEQQAEEMHLPKRLLDMLIFRFYNLHTIEPFGRIDKTLLMRPLTTGQIKEKLGITFGDLSQMSEHDVNFYAPRRTDSADINQNEFSQEYEGHDDNNDDYDEEYEYEDGDEYEEDDDEWEDDNSEWEEEEEIEDAGSEYYPDDEDYYYYSSEPPYPEISEFNQALLFFLSISTLLAGIIQLLCPYFPLHVGTYDTSWRSVLHPRQLWYYDGDLYDTMVALDSFRDEMLRLAQAKHQNNQFILNNYI